MNHWDMKVGGKQSTIFVLLSKPNRVRDNMAVGPLFPVSLDHDIKISCAYKLDQTMRSLGLHETCVKWSEASTLKPWFCP